MPPVLSDSAVAVIRRARRRPRNRLLLVAGALFTLTLAVFAARTLLGDYTITVPDFLRIVGGEQIPGATFILMESKLPRAVLGVLVGVAFGTAGAIFQSTLRNPLASPDMLGITVGSSVGVLFAIVVLSLPGAALPVAGVVGAVTTAVLIRTIAGDDSGYRLVLVGVTTAAALIAILQYLLTRAEEYDVQIALRWIMGSLSAAAWPMIGPIAVCLLVLLPAVALIVRAQRALELGPEVATGLGISRRYGDTLLLLAVLLCALGVIAAGPVAFVALAAGPIARVLNAGRSTLIGAGMVGAIVVVGADYVGAYAIPEANLPVGVVTGAFGAPFLLWLLATGRAGRRVG